MEFSVNCLNTPVAPLQTGLYPTITMVRILATFLVWVIPVFGFSQGERYLENINFKDGDSQSTRMFYASLNSDNSRLAATNTIMEFDMKTGNEMKFRTVISSQLLNLTSGRLEGNLQGTSAYYMEKDLVLVENPEQNGKWIKMADFKIGKTFYVDSETRTRKEVNIPEGFSITGAQGNYVFAVNFLTAKSLVLEPVNESLTIKHQFDLFMIKVTDDNKYVYGVETHGKPVRIFDLQSGRMIRSVNVSDYVLYHLLSNGDLVTSSMNNEIKIINPNGSVKRKFSGAGIFFTVSKDEKQLIAVTDKGKISQWDMEKGISLSHETDTYISGSGSMKKPGLPQSVSNGKFYLIPYSNGIVSIFSTQERRVIANLFVDESDWAVIAKDGRFDGTPTAFSKLEWREYSNEKIIRTTSVESSFDKYFTPRLLYSILHEADQKEPVRESLALPSSDNSEREVSSAQSRMVENSRPIHNIGEDVKSVPVLKLVSLNGKVITSPTGSEIFNATQKKLVIDLKVSENKDKVHEVQLFHNGKLVGIQPANASGVYSFSANLNSLFGTMNALYAVATSLDGLNSEKCKMIVEYKEEQNGKPKLYSLIVGINKYQNPRYELNYALPDAMAFKSQLEKSNTVLFESIVVKSLKEAEVTKANVVKILKELAGVMKEQDMFIFYYAGHGTMGSPPSNEFYIVPFDVTQLFGNDAMLKEKALSASELKALSMAMLPQKQVYIIDACHSAGALSSAVRGAAEERAIGQLARSTGTFWLTAAGSEQFASEFEQLGHGVFTYSLLEALQGKDEASASDGSLTIRELSSYIEQRVPELSMQYKGNPQYPASFSFGNDFPLTVFPARK